MEAEEITGRKIALEKLGKFLGYGNRTAWKGVGGGGYISPPGCTDPNGWVCRGWQNFEPILREGMGRQRLEAANPEQVQALIDRTRNPYARRLMQSLWDGARGVQPAEASPEPVFLPDEDDGYPD